MSYNRLSIVYNNNNESQSKIPGSRDALKLGVKIESCEIGFICVGVYTDPLPKYIPIVQLFNLNWHPARARTRTRSVVRPVPGVSGSCAWTLASARPGTRPPPPGCIGSVYGGHLAADCRAGSQVTTGTGHWSLGQFYTNTSNHSSRENLQFQTK